VDLARTFASASSTSILMRLGLGKWAASQSNVTVGTRCVL